MALALVKRIEEIKEFVSVAITSELDSILPDIKWAEEQYIRPHLGTTQFDELHYAYHSTDEALMTPALTFLLEKVQEALYNLAYAKYLAIGQLHIGEQGVRIQTDGNFKQAFSWQVEGVERYLASKGFDGLEKLLTFLEGNKDAYPLWVSSPAYTIFKKYFINSAADFSEYYNINYSRRTYLAMLPVMKKVEEFTFEPVLSLEFFDELKTEIAQNALSEDNQKLMRYLKPALAHLTIAKAIPELSLEISENAIVLNEFSDGGKSKKQAPDNLLSVKMKSAYDDGMAYLNKLIAYLAANASETKYPTYYQQVIAPTQDKPEIKQSGNIYNAF